MKAYCFIVHHFSVLRLRLNQLKAISCVDRGHCGEKFALSELLVMESHAEISSVSCKAESSLENNEKFMN